MTTRIHPTAQIEDDVVITNDGHENLTAELSHDLYIAG